MSKKQFNTEQEIIDALKVGVVYYRMYGPDDSPEKTAKVVVAPDEDDDHEWEKVSYKYVGMSGRVHNDYIGDMQNSKGKAVFTDLEMAKAWNEEFTPLGRMRIEQKGTQPMSSEWKTIDTCTDEIKGQPGRVLIAFLSDGECGMKGEWMILSAYWDYHFRTEWDDDNDCEAAFGAWTDGAVKSFGYEETWSYEPTHWMPLPPPPAPDQERNEG